MRQVDAFWAARNVRQISPDFFRGKAGDGSEQARQRLADAPDRSLCASPGSRLGRGDVQAVFEHVEIEGAEFSYAEIIHAVMDAMEGKLVVPAPHIRDQGSGQAQHVLVDLFQLSEWDCVGLGIKVVQVAEDVAE